MEKLAIFFYFIIHFNIIIIIILQFYFLLSGFKIEWDNTCEELINGILIGTSAQKLISIINTTAKIFYEIDNYTLMLRVRIT